MIPEYAGYGMSGGTPSEAACYATADAAFHHLAARDDVDSGKIVVGGWSLGGAVAIDLAARKPVVGLVSFSSFTRLAELAHRQFPFLPASLLLRHRFESERKIGRVHVPILIGHGRDDTLIPYAMSDRLARAAGGAVKRLSVSGAGHNDFYLYGGPAILKALEAFLDSVTSRAAP
jgi:fermentation-respiration switch protein FrsA (DUF1100 family)